MNLLHASMIFCLGIFFGKMNKRKKEQEPIEMLSICRKKVDVFQVLHTFRVQQKSVIYSVDTQKQNGGIQLIISPRDTTKIGAD